MKPSKFQKLVLAAPADHDLFLGGGRGGGKSFAQALLFLQHAASHGTDARGLYLRQSYAGLTDFEALTRELFAVADPKARYNSQSHIWRLSNGAILELGQLTTEADYAKYQGRSFTLIQFDEVGQYADARLIDRMRSNLRGPKGVPVRMIIAANPGGVGHQWIARRFVFGHDAWTPFNDELSGRAVIACPSTYKNNQEIDQDGYAEQLAAACVGDKELLKAWLEGDWAVARGAYFAGVLDESRNAIDTWSLLPRDRGGDPWIIYLAHDYGIAAPSVTYLVAKSPGVEHEGKYYSRDSLVLLDELATVDPENLNKGNGYTIPELAFSIKKFANGWKVPASGCADDAIFSTHGHEAGSIADEFRRYGVRFEPAKKADRLTGWERMRRLLQDAGKPDVPGMYVSRSCRYFWETVPYLARDVRRLDDLDTTGPDHAADAARYATLYQRPAQPGKLKIRWIH